ncbi:efflux RND transporter permease subunit [Neobacillus sp. PS3-34]|uniref:efflux RND transporter permease subunit n=1 Tax=Neobacillus sp. PS3-34 TaxID=3070678 RepID=UPI0027E059CC|nr:efflux RND transporter permease subunit [Neobacillus sp. PS3-34]WML50138.1 efflux RND transporter permease subunit [Neobacillus sp. PS3-34]
MPKSVNHYKEGASAAMDEGFKNMAIAISVSILLVYLVMVIAFGEGKAPFVILFSIPFSVIGALIGLYIVNEPIGMPAMIGLLMLNGIVVTNAIVLIDKVKQNEKEGMGTHDSLIEAGVIRIRPILMTAIATVGALIPMALSAHAGIVSSSLAVVVIGGLTTSTLLTLFIVPVMYSLFHPKKKGKRNQKEQEPYTAAI